MQENSVQISSEELIDIIQFTIAHVAGQGCSVDDAKNVYAAWQRFA